MEKREPSYPIGVSLPVSLPVGTATMENSMEVP